MRPTVAALIALGAAACAGAGKKNAEACEAYLASLECGDLDTTPYTSSYPCSAFEDGSGKCDAVPYFECLVDAIACDPEAPALLVDPEGRCAIPEGCAAAS